MGIFRKYSKDIQKEYINLNKLIEEAKESVLFNAIQKKIDIKIINNVKQNEVFIDENMIKSVLRNLLNNAIKFTQNEGEVSINTKQYKNHMEISVKDNGMGIKKEKRETIFNTDYYETMLGTNNETGTGFGLLICKEFINKHGGKIWITSEPGIGSEFKFTIPISSS
jgi:signal transduction histidine kinase